MLIQPKVKRIRFIKSCNLPLHKSWSAWRCGKWTSDKVINREIKVLVGRDVILFGSHCKQWSGEKLRQCCCCCEISQRERI